MTISPISSTPATLAASFDALSSGRSVTSATSNPAGLAVAEYLQASAAGTDQANGNVGTALDALNVEQGATQSAGTVLQQLNTLAVQAGSDLLTPSERADVHTQANQLVQQLNTLGQQTSFNGVPLLQGGNETVQAGAAEGNTATISGAAVSAANLGLSRLDLSSSTSAQQAISTVQAAIQNLSSQQAQIGAISVGLGAQANDNAVLSNNVQTAQSNIADTPIGQAAVAANTTELLNSISLSVLNQANDQQGFLSAFVSQTV